MKKLEVSTSVIKDGQLQLLLHEDKGDQYAASGRMLVDSDNLAFVYILEQDDEYVYLHIGQSIWSELQHAYENKLPVFLTLQDTFLELVQFHEEMDYLLESIDDNCNYGQVMVDAVTKVFGKATS